jgi:hypothetical protein
LSTPILSKNRNRELDLKIARGGSQNGTGKKETAASVLSTLVEKFGEYMATTGIMLRNDN